MICAVGFYCKLASEHHELIRQRASRELLKILLIQYGGRGGSCGTGRVVFGEICRDPVLKCGAAMSEAVGQFHIILCLNFRRFAPMRREGLGHFRQ